MRNITTLLGFLFISISFTGFGQKIQVKKETILVDKKEIPIKIKSDSHNVSGQMGNFHSTYTFSNTTNSEVFLIVDSKGKMLGPKGPKEIWLEISNPDNSKTNAVDINFGGGKRGVVKYLINEVNFFTIDGTVNQENINAFLQTNTTSNAKISAEGSVKQEEAGRALKNKIQPFVQKDMSITKGGRFGTEVIGNVISPDKYTETINSPIKIFDLDNNLIATAITEVITPVKVTLIDGSKFEYRTKYKLNGALTKQQFLTELVEKVVEKGYSLSHSIASNKEEKLEKIADNNRKKYDLAKKNSSNIYNQKGYVLDEDGEKFQGNIFVRFEKVKNPSDWSGVVGSNSFGSSLLLKFTDKKGKNKTKAFLAKKNTSFCILNDNGNESCYEGIIIQSNGMLGQAATVTFEGVGQVQYMKKVYEEGKLSIYQSTPSNKYVLKLENKDKAFNFAFGSLIKEEKKLNKLKEYLGGCNVIEEYKEEDYFNIDKIKELINFYNTSCN